MRRTGLRTGLLAIVTFLLSTTLEAKIVKVELDGIINPIMSEFIRGAVDKANQDKSEFLLIRLATPGGLGSSMKEIVQAILNSEVPVVCYVNPQGSHAASAGFFILLAADVAVMSPGTNTGAATPILQFGGENKDLLKKVKSDVLANLRSYVKRRGRNYELAKLAVEEARSFTAREALEGKLIDLVAENEQDLLSQLQGREITRFNGEKQILDVEGQAVELVEMTFRQRVLAMITNPNVALLLVALGALAVYVEFSNPGLIAPGVLGGISLLLGLMGFSALPVNLVGAALILLALGLFVAEASVQGFGILGTGGAIALLLGLLILIDSPLPELRIDLGLAVGVALGFALISILLLRLALKAQRSRVSTGSEAMLGMLGTARSEVGGQGGKVFVNGELWDATSASALPEGSKVRVVGARRLLLEVEIAGDF